MRPFFVGVLRYRWFVLAAILGVTVWFGTFLWPLDQITYDFSFNRMFTQYGGDTDRLRQFNEDFGDDVGMVSMLVALPQDGKRPPVAQRVSGTVFEPRVLREILTVSDELKARPELVPSQVVGLGELSDLHAETLSPNHMRVALGLLDEAAKKHPGWTAQKAVEAAESGAAVPDALAKAVADYRAAAASIMDHRLYVGQVVSEDALATRVLGRFRLDHSSPGKRDPLIGDLYKRADTLREAMPEGAAVHYTGLPIIEHDYAEITLHDLTFFTPIIGVVICLFLFVLFRSIWAIVNVMTAVFLATAWGIGVMQWMGEPINVVNNVIPVLILVIGVAESIHILARYYQYSAIVEDKNEAILKAMCAMAPACALASFTTGVGFASLVSASIPAIRDFGIFSGIAILFVFLMQMTILPIAMSLTPKPNGAFMAKRDGTRMGRWLTWLTDLVTRRYKLVLSIGVVGGVLAGLGMALMHKDMRILHELDEDHPTAQALLNTQERLGGMLVHAVAIEGREYPDRRCAEDAECVDPTCDEAACGFAGCCRTQVCRQVDRPFKLVSHLRDIGLDLTDQEEMPTFIAMSDVMRQLRARALEAQGSSASPGGDNGSDHGGDVIEIEDDDDDGSGDEIVIDDDGGSAAPDKPRQATPPSAPRLKLGHCAESIKNPALIRAVEALDDWLSLPEHRNVVGRATSVTDLIKEMNLAFAGPDDPANYRVPKDLDRAGIHQLLFPLESAGGDVLSRIVTRDYTRTNVTIFAYDSGAAAWHELEAELHKKNAELFDTPALADKFEVHITGNTTLAHSALGAVVTDMVTSLSVAFGFIFLLMTLLFRSLKVGFYSMIPNIWPVFVTMAFMGYAGIDLRVSSVIIFSVSLGIAVDDTIHFLHRLGEEVRAKSASVDDALERTIHGSGRAIMLTTIVLCMGFGAQAMSSFIAVQQFGALSAFTLGVAVFGDLFLLPAMVKALRLDKSFGGRRTDDGSSGEGSSGKGTAAAAAAAGP